MNIKFCRDCKYLWAWKDAGLCSHDNSKNQDMVWAKMQPAFDMRNSEQHCGKSAQWFELRDDKK